jgi:hypothetical protein
MEVFGQIIDTLLLCFCEDTENVRVPPFLAFLRLYTSALTLRFADFLCSTSKSMRRLL